MIKKLIKKIYKVLLRSKNAIISTEKQVIKFKYDEWLQIAQKGEFQFHLRNKWRQSNDFMNQTIKLFDYFGFTRNQYENKMVIDLGAGSKLRSKYFIDARIIAIEPLAEKFIRDIPWCDLSDAEKVYSAPAEQWIEKCENSADLVLSINVLDHCYDFEMIITNVASYLKDEGIAFLSFDKHETADEMHPLQLDEIICEKIFENCGLKTVDFSKGANGILNTYGHGPYCLNYTLSRVK